MAKKCLWKVEICFQSTKSQPSCFSTWGASNASTSGCDPIL